MLSNHCGSRVLKLEPKFHMLHFRFYSNRITTINSKLKNEHGGASKWEIYWIWRDPENSQTFKVIYCWTSLLYPSPYHTVSLICGCSGSLFHFKVLKEYYREKPIWENYHELNLKAGTTTNKPYSSWQCFYFKI